MNIYLLILLIIVNANADIKPKSYVVNLNLPPLERWKEIAIDFKYSIKDLKEILLEMIPKELLPITDILGLGLEKFIPREMVEEIRGYAKYSEMKLGELFEINLIYELSEMCTSIVAEDVNGNIIHGRNLDYRFTEILRNITIDVEFQKDSKTVYMGTTFAGYIGLLTGMKPYAFSISINERRTSDGYWKNALIAIMDRSAQLSGYLLRETLHSAISFTDAVVKIAYTDTMSPAYYTIGGVYKGQGAVVTKDDIYPADIYYIDTSVSRWYVLETNYDRWNPTPKTDDRRKYAITYMDEIGSNNITDKTMFKLLSTHPIYRVDHMTVYTTVMSAARPKDFSTTIRDQN